jgi:hypothetical protein
MTTPFSSDAKNLISKPTPKLPHERDETPDGSDPQDRPEIQKAFEDSTTTGTDTDKGPPSDATYNKGVLGNSKRESGIGGGRDKPDPAAR